MRAWQLTWTELRRVTSTRMGRLTVLALVLVPTLYAGLYLYANHDPYAALDRVPAALVVQDQGTTGSDGEHTNAGREVADDLLDGQDFGWHEVSRSEAEDGVEHGRYDFALVIPEGFSASLNSVSGSDPEQARLTLVTNDANSYLSTTIANTVVGKVQQAVTRKVGKQAALTFLTGISDTRQGLLSGADGAEKLRTGLVTANTGAGTLAEGADTLHTGTVDLAEGTDRLASGLATMQTKTADLPSSTRQLAEGARKVADADATIAAYGDTARTLVGQLRSDYKEHRATLREELRAQGLDAAQIGRVLAVYDRLDTPIGDANSKARQLAGKLDELRTGSRKVADGADTLADAAGELRSGIVSAHAGAEKVADGATRLERGSKNLATGADELHAGLGELRSGARTLRDGLKDGAAQIPATDAEAREQMAKTIASPVRVQNSSDATADSYGEGLAPFFLSLATWIGGYVLFLMVRPLSRRALAAGQRPWRIAVGAWLAPALLGAIQMVLAVAVVSLAVGVVPGNVPAVLGVLVLASLSFVAVIHLLNAAFGTPGQFLGLVLMVLQLVSAGGTFPWQTIPSPLHPLHQVLPMPHAVDAVRLAMYGGPSGLLWQHLLVLAAWLLGSLALTSLVARRQRIWTPRRVNPEFEM